MKPANVLVRDEGKSLRIQLIDFGLALRQDTLRNSLKYVNTLAGASIAGTLEYAAPEQLGRLPGVKPGPYSDIYGFGRTCCYALFQTTQPTLKHWESVPRPLAELLGNCLGETPAERPHDFIEVLRGLDRVQADMKLRKVASRVETMPTAELVEAVPVRRASRTMRAPRVHSREPLLDETLSSPLKTAVAGVPIWMWGIVAFGLLLVLVGGVSLLALLSSKPQTEDSNLSVVQNQAPQRASPAVSRSESSSPRTPARRSKTGSAQPRVITPAVKDAEERKVYLSDLMEFDVGSFAPFRHFGKNGLNGDNFNHQIVVDGRGFTKALCMVPPDRSFSSVKYLVEPAESFQTLVGFEDSAREKLPSDFVFEVLGDGKSLWKSDPIHERGPFLDCRVSLKGVRVLELRVFALASSNGGNAVWLDPYLVRPADYQHPKGVPSYVVFEPPQPTKWPELLGYWSMDEGKGARAADACGQREARLIHAEWAPGIRGKTVRCLGADSYLDYSASTPISFPSAGPFTLCFWVQTTRKDATLLSQRNNKNGASMIDVTIEREMVKFRVRQDGNEVDFPVEVKSRVKINDGQWHHLALTRNVGRLELFIDGAAQKHTSGPAASGTITTDLCTLGSERRHIMTRFVIGNHHFEGCLDEFCIFNRVLTQEEIDILAGRARGK